MGRANKAPCLQALPEHAPSVCRCSGPATGAGEQAPLVRTAGLSRQPRGTLGMAPGARSDGADPGVSVPVAFEVLPGQAGLVPALLQHPSLPT